MDCNPNNLCPCNKEKSGHRYRHAQRDNDLKSQGEGQVKEQGRSDASPSQRAPKIPIKPSDARKKQGRILPRASEKMSKETR